MISISCLIVYSKPSWGFGYFCVVGRCGVMPTGKPGMKVFDDNPWLLGQVAN